ncbi:hypothetical protein JTE90_027533 [Oedothorax gibbosus]|uniref:phosphoribosylamine--glycine ligase n=1 Tax=Oedothorax gibbosus TaxID=931172 RepID=A0AAV6VJM6_9ARAC|nr:hypothetical protein JTE90_027533 [Oedothorax gibbosus]
MPPAQDHKRLLNNNEGPNTGGMGAYCRCLLVSEAYLEYLKENVLQRVIDGMKAQGSPYVGVLYAGLMMTKDGPKVLEYNCRFGDPETQVILPLLESDLYSIMLACVYGKLSDQSIEWSKNKHAVGVVVVSGGYPESYQKGKVITGLEKIVGNTIVFHADTSKASGNLVTSGGRVLTVVTFEDTLKEASAVAYLNTGFVKFEGTFYRTDIAAKSLEK